MEHLYVKFGDPSCVGFFEISSGETYRERQTANENPTNASAVGVGNNVMISGRRRYTICLHTFIWSDCPSF